MNRRSLVFGISGILVVILTLAVAIININDWSGITAAALAVAVWSEAALFGGFIAIERLAQSRQQVLLRSGCGVTVGVYSVVAFIVSLLFMLFFKQSGKLFFTIQLILIVFAAILWLAFIAVSGGIRERDSKTLSSMAYIDGCVNRLNSLMDERANSEFSEKIGKIAEELRFTDTTLASEADSQIEKTISALEIELDGEDKFELNDRVENLCTKLDSLITKRKYEVKSKKQGGF